MVRPGCTTSGYFRQIQRTMYIKHIYSIFLSSRAVPLAASARSLELLKLPRPSTDRTPRRLASRRSAQPLRDALQMKRVPALAPHHRGIVPGKLCVRRAPIERDATDPAHVADVARAPGPRTDAVPRFDFQRESRRRRGRGRRRRDARRRSRVHARDGRRARRFHGSSVGRSRARARTPTRGRVKMGRHNRASV